MLWWNRDSARANPREALRFLTRSREISNWTYELENEDESLAVIAALLGAAAKSVALYRNELDADVELLDELERTLAAVPRRDPEVRLGYRKMHYCLVRLMKPGTVVELGVHDGLGAAVVLRALERNRAEGYEGHLLAFDDSPESGWLIPERLRGGMTSFLGDANEFLDDALAQHGVDLLIQDIGPGIDTETEMFDTALRHSRGPLLVRGEMDERENVRRFAEANGGRFLAFTEKPSAHFWRGTKIGLAHFGAEACGTMAAWGSDRQRARGSREVRGSTPRQGARRFSGAMRGSEYTKQISSSSAGAETGQASSSTSEQTPASRPSPSGR